MCTLCHPAKPMSAVISASWTHPCTTAWREERPVNHQHTCGSYTQNVYIMPSSKTHVSSDISQLNTSMYNCLKRGTASQPLTHMWQLHIKCVHYAIQQNPCQQWYQPAEHIHEQLPEERNGQSTINRHAAATHKMCTLCHPAKPMSAVISASWTHPCTTAWREERPVNHQQTCGSYTQNVYNMPSSKTHVSSDISQLNTSMNNCLKRGTTSQPLTHKWQLHTKCVQYAIQQNPCQLD